jgi:flagellar motor switch protein FliM
MATKDILSQDEIDALLHGVDSGDVESGSDLPGEDNELIPYDITSQEQLVKGRLPALEMINERFVRYFRVSLFNTIRRPAEVSLENIEMMKFSDYMQGMFVPTSLSLIRVHPLRGTALVMIHPKLIFTLVDNFFGGSGRYYNKIEGRDFTTMELRVIRMITDSIFTDYQESWKSVKEIEMEYLSHEINPHIAQIVRANEIVIVNSFHIELDGGGGLFQITLPYSMIEPIRELLNRSITSDRSDTDKQWGLMLREELYSAEVELNCILSEVKMDVRKLATLKTGDIIQIEKPGLIEATIENIPLIKGSYGQSNGMVSFKVDSFLKLTSMAQEIADAPPTGLSEIDNTQLPGVGRDISVSEN